MSVEWAEPWRAIESANGLYLACGPVMRGGEGWANLTQSTDDDWFDGGEVVDGEVDEAEALPAGHAAMVLSFHMVYHPGYAVPVLFFEAANEAGGPMGLAELWPRLPLSRGVGAGADAEQIQLTYLALAEAPHLPGRAMLMLHPCETAAVLEAVVTDGSEAADEAAGEAAVEGAAAASILASHATSPLAQFGQRDMLLWLSLYGPAVGVTTGTRVGPGLGSVTFTSRRTQVAAPRGMVASSQAAATAAGLAVLQAGGNAADAAVATAAALAVTEPCSTGLGGDAFVLYYDAESGTVQALNGSGRSPAALDAEAVAAAVTAADPAAVRLPWDSVHAVTVPGAAAAWMDTLEHWGSGAVTAAEVLAPAIALAEDGYAVGDVTACGWTAGSHKLTRSGNAAGSELLTAGGCAPSAGEIMTNPGMARVLRTLASDGKAGFYSGWPAAAILDVLSAHGSYMEASDLEAHTSEIGEPISYAVDGVRLYECAPNGQGLVALVALNILASRTEELKALGHNSAGYLHMLIEALRMAFAAAGPYVAEPKAHGEFAHLLSPEWGVAAAGKIDAGKASANGAPSASSDTVYFCVVDAEGNAASVVNSNYEGFGSGLVPPGTGFTLQNRGCNFALRG
ncbi:acylase ACY 1 [Thecamonas trahens ATCC 50062]|uniref:Acylase ACY 1 n=1 Tax=Thecamonas trahens ATCC 50062 TaxID=461836 RepID=A0A0L0D457_THETB|nr:acylase ACY 1 [Thecamonas trahens ATCC 50062]KNC46891.1 acylase ACY 1 [Thecamonas trahens ATCC 50062]|eukprot:XP_013760164.1 acylase ACY 1 [Thecamonas trahens ATCC 50062]